MMRITVRDEDIACIVEQTPQGTIKVMAGAIHPTGVVVDGTSLQNEFPFALYGDPFSTLIEAAKKIMDGVRPQVEALK